MKTKFSHLVCGSLVAAALSLHSRPSPQVDLSKVDFAKECLTVSDPSDRLLYAHEEILNSFLAVGGKFGKGRMMTIHLSNAHLAEHGGTTVTPGEWNERGTRYSETGEWGLLGNLDQPSAKVYSLKPSPYLKQKGDPDAPNSFGVAKELNLEERTADLFEAYAVAQLKKGDALVRWERPDFMRAVGAVRAEAVCLKCHEVKQGDLLGAFTYQFTKVSVEEAAKEDQRLKEAHVRLPPREDPLVLEGYRKGLSLEAIARTLPGHEKIDQGKNRWYAVHNVQTQLLHAGIVTEEMLAEQRQHRKWSLDGIVSSLDSVNQAK